MGCGRPHAPGYIYIHMCASYITPSNNIKHTYTTCKQVVLDRFPEGRELRRLLLAALDLCQRHSLLPSSSSASASVAAGSGTH